jgi:hypothetical protein
MANHFQNGDLEFVKPKGYQVKEEGGNNVGKRYESVNKGEAFIVFFVNWLWARVFYNLWRQRNSVKFGNQPKSEEKILQNICSEVSSRIVRKGSGKFKDSDTANVLPCKNWGIPGSFLS